MLVKIGFMVQMLKRALSETGEMCEPGEEDKQSHHSDSIMECVISMSSMSSPTTANK